MEEINVNETLSKLRKQYIYSKDLYFEFLLKIEENFWCNLVNKFKIMMKEKEKTNNIIKELSKLKELNELNELKNKKCIDNNKVCFYWINLKKKIIDKMEIIKHRFQVKNIKIILNSIKKNGRNGRNILTNKTNTINSSLNSERLNWIKKQFSTRNIVVHFKAWIMYNNVDIYNNNGGQNKIIASDLSVYKKEHNYDILKNKRNTPWFNFLGP